MSEPAVRDLEERWLRAAVAGGNTVLRIRVGAARPQHPPIADAIAAEVLDHVAGEATTRQIELHGVSASLRPRLRRDTVVYLVSLTVPYGGVPRPETYPLAVFDDTSEGRARLDALRARGPSDPRSLTEAERSFDGYPPAQRRSIAALRDAQVAWAFRHAAAVVEVREELAHHPPMNCDVLDATFYARRWLRGSGVEGLVIGREVFDGCTVQRLGRAQLGRGDEVHLVALDDHDRIIAYEPADAASLARVQRWLQTPAPDRAEVARLAMPIEALPNEGVGIEWARVRAEVRAGAGGVPIVRLRPVEPELRSLDGLPAPLVDPALAPAYFEHSGPELGAVVSGGLYWVAVLVRDPRQRYTTRPSGPTAAPWLLLPGTLVPDGVGFALMVLRSSRARGVFPE